MIQVKVIDEQHEEDLTQSVNLFLSRLSDKQIMNINFATTSFAIEKEQVFCFSAMIVYRMEEED